MATFPTSARAREVPPRRPKQRHRTPKRRPTRLALDARDAAERVPPSELEQVFPAGVGFNLRAPSTSPRTPSKGAAVHEGGDPLDELADLDGLPRATPWQSRRDPT